MWIQRALRLEARPRGVHLITRDVLDALPELGEMRTGMLNVFIRHTSASLAPMSFCHANTLQISGLPGSSFLMRWGSVTMLITCLSISSSDDARVMALP